MVVFLTFILLAISLPALAFPGTSPDELSSKGVRIALPPKQANLDSMMIPGPGFQWRAPRPNDIRGPCPGLNTLANHGYLPRSGVASFEEIVTATTHGFNMDYNLSLGITAFGMLARGNAYVNKLSIGLQSPLVPPLPGKIDGPVARGLGSHGRFEGDVSMTRPDAAVGDNIHFDPGLYNQLLDLVAQYGDNSTVTGPRSIVNMRVMQEFKFKRFLDDQRENKKLAYHVGRLIFSYGEASFALHLFANGTDGLLSVPTMSSFFRDQRFPPRWYRRQGGGDLDIIGQTADEIYNAHPVPPGANDANGVYVPDQPSDTDGCSLYSNLAGDSLPGILLNTTGLLKQNVDFLLGHLRNLFPGCPLVVPHGPANV